MSRFGLVRSAARLAATATVVFAMTGVANAASKVRVAFGDIASVESLNLLIAFERATLDLGSKTIIDDGAKVTVSWDKAQTIPVDP